MKAIKMQCNGKKLELSIDMRRQEEKKYRILKYSPEKPLAGVPFSQRTPFVDVPHVSGIPHKEIIDDRNKIFASACKNQGLEAPNVVTSPREKFQNLFHSGSIEAKFSRQQLQRFDHVFEETIQKVADSFQSYDEGEGFDYWLLQASLKMKLILSHGKSTEPKVNKYTHNRSPTTTTFNALPTLEFERIYGPINEKDYDMMKLLQNFRGNAKTIKDFKRRLLLLSVFSNKGGVVAACKVVEEFALSALNVPQAVSDLLLETISNDSDHSMLNVNPITNRTHTDWFIIQRFATPSTPADLFIRHEKLEKLDLLEYKPSVGNVIVDGLWPSLIDLAFTWHVPRSVDPCLKEKSANSDVESKRAHTWSSACQQIRHALNLYICGIECDRFMGSLKLKKGFKLFGTIDNNVAMKSLPDLCITSELPGTTSTILFPTFMKDILPDGPYPIVYIIEHVWKRVLCLVKFKGGKIRTMDFQEFYWITWKKWLSVEEWGFQRIVDFVDWCMERWNPLGMEEGIIMKPRPVSETEEPLLMIYKPREWQR